MQIFNRAERAPSRKKNTRRRESTPKKSYSVEIGETLLIGEPLTELSHVRLHVNLFCLENACLIRSFGLRRESHRLNRRHVFSASEYIVLSNRRIFHKGCSLGWYRPRCEAFVSESLSRWSRYYFYITTLRYPGKRIPRDRSLHVHASLNAYLKRIGFYLYSCIANNTFD
jgi:hypothetical protein